MNPHAMDLNITRSMRLRYLLHLPAGAEDSGSGQWPLILFLHGHGQSGDDLDTVRRTGLPQYIDEQPDFPFITIAPQCPWNTWWPELADGILQLLDHILASYPVDAQRVYLTGLSMGGFGSWYIGAGWPQRFAAIAPICGGGYWFHGFPQRVCALKDVPVWAFHGARDPVVPLAASEQLVETLKSCGGQVHLTVYPDLEHDSWTVTYRNPELYSWFLQQRRTAAPKR